MLVKMVTGGGGSGGIDWSALPVIGSISSGTAAYTIGSNVKDKHFMLLQTSTVPTAGTTIDLYSADVQGIYNILWIDTSGNVQIKSGLQAVSWFQSATYSGDTLTYGTSVTSGLNNATLVALD